MAGDALQEIGTELYGLAPGKFTAARNARAKQAREAGDKELAAAIAKLPRPAVTGWLANQLVRRHADDVRALLELGEELREATASLDADRLRELSRRQRQAVDALVEQARRLGRDAGQTVSEDTARGLAETLHAALADPEAADQLAAGQLTGVLSRSGFPGEAPPVPRKPVPKGDRRAAAEQEVEAARGEERARAAERDETARALAAAERSLAAAQESAEALQRQLDEALDAQADAEKAVRTARRAATGADRAATLAEHRLQEATQRMHRRQNG
jgi:hypothetical protein